MPRRAAGSYALVLRLETPTEIQVGRLGSFAFPAGYYVYAGSALSGLEARIARHFRATKRLRWHLDYLGLVATPVAAYAIEGATRRECELAAAVAALPGAGQLIRGFGSSDCRCPSHLAWLPTLPDLKGLVEGLLPYREEAGCY